MTDLISSVEETVVNGDVVTTITETKTMNPDHSVTTTTTVDKTDHADEDNHMTTISQITTLPDLEKKIIRQIEYYFSDINMVRDKFLKNEIVKDDGWIPLSILTTFKRLQSLTTDFKTIINALKKSFSGLLQLNETENKIRRHPDRPLPNSQAELELSLQNRTVYVKGFPKTEDVTLDKLLQFFEKYGATDNIQMKKQFKTKEFNGSVFVIFPNEDKAREFVENSKKIPIKYDDQSILECSLQDDYFKDKPMELTINEKEKRSNDKQFKKEKKQQELNKKTNEHLEKLNNGNLLGALIHLIGMAADTTRELIKAKFNPFTKMPWIDFNKGDAEAWVRLNEANTAKDVLEKVLAIGDGKLIIENNEITCRIVEGEEEAQFWKQANEKRAAQRTQKKERYNSGKRSGRDKRTRRDGQKRKREQDQDNESNNDNEEPSTESKSPKKTKNISTD
ncbi:unnamed protein product [Rotaria sp. Silwood2]|nr:unnamed protein product [Rotaria sp. Silwood2]CAF2859999.1 unnamed protein product [Rotaria sp. Silwood2]CAF3076593.1 unnamed protein product [Rotaria sp. Silwood2]CAF3224366.1 unnamed protein product [Rotaria sp. Silwood2]CAF3972011.1 unnamed protein product [Rotaria sp. Silwood2]